MPGGSSDHAPQILGPGDIDASAAVAEAFGLVQSVLDGEPSGPLASPAAAVLGALVVAWMRAHAVQGGAVTEEEIRARVADALGGHRDWAMFSAITSGMRLGSATDPG